MPVREGESHEAETAPRTIGLLVACTELPNRPSWKFWDRPGMIMSSV